MIPARVQEHFSYSLYLWHSCLLIDRAHFQDMQYFTVLSFNHLDEESWFFTFIVFLRSCDWKCVNVLWLFVLVLWVGLQCVIVVFLVVFLGHTYFFGHKRRNIIINFVCGRSLALTSTGPGGFMAIVVLCPRAGKA